MHPSPVNLSVPPIVAQVSPSSDRPAFIAFQGNPDARLIAHREGCSSSVAVRHRPTTFKQGISTEEEEQLMKNFGMALAFAAATLVLPHSGEAAEAVKAVPGYYNPATGTFAPMVTKSPAVAPVARTGTVKISITLSIEAAIGTDVSISCQGSVNTSDASFDNYASANGVVVRSGAKGTVVLTIPYAWTMAASGEMVTIYTSCSEGSPGSSTVGGVGHTISLTVPGFAEPAKAGTVTTKSLTASM
jgi:hypothetical protein